jgi:beta-glucanase (GH16 family)
VTHLAELNLIAANGISISAQVRNMVFYRPENVIVRDGILYIEARKDNPEVDNRRDEFPYTSGKITTGGIMNHDGTVWPQKFAVKPGDRIEARMKSMRGEGFWPAFWLIGATSNEYGGHKVLGWPRCGEIDILEFRGGEEHRLVQTLHYGYDWREGQGWYSTFMNWVWAPSNEYRLTGNTSYNWAENWHIYGAVWDETQIQFYVDHPVSGEIIITQTIPWNNLASISVPYTDIFHANPAGFSIILNLALGGNMGNGRPPDSAFTDGTGRHTMQVDWVRVYQP